MALDVQWLGCLDYSEALTLQMARVETRRSGECGDVLLLVEHPPAITLGRSSHDENLLLSPEELAARDIGVHRINRGGDVTYHAPGQLVGYLICDLNADASVDVGAYLRRIEAALMDALSGLGISAKRIKGLTGVYLDRAGESQSAEARDRKIASIGVGIRGWVSFHGFALNVSLDLAGFESIVPCGLQQIEMTSVARELGVSTSDGAQELDEHVRALVSESFRKHFS